MLKIILKIETCNECGDCCLLDCKGEYFNGKYCVHPEKHYLCNMFPISTLQNKYYLRECKGVALETLPINELNEIIRRLNNGEKNFEVITQNLYFNATESK